MTFCNFGEEIKGNAERMITETVRLRRYREYSTSGREKHLNLSSKKTIYGAIILRYCLFRGC